MIFSESNCMRGQMKKFLNRASSVTSVSTACQSQAVFGMGGERGVKGVQFGGFSSPAGEWGECIRAPPP